MTCPFGFSWISSEIKKQGDIEGGDGGDGSTTPEETTTTTTNSGTRRLAEEVETDTEAEEPATTTPEPTTEEPTTPLPVPTFNQTEAIASINATLPFEGFGGVLKCGKTSVNVIYYNTSSKDIVVAGLDETDFDWPKCKVEIKRNDISMMSVVKFHEYKGGNIVSDMWMTAEVFNKYEFPLNITYNLACIYQEKDPVEFIEGTIKVNENSDNSESDGAAVTIELDTSSLPTSCYVLAGKNGEKIDFEQSDAYQLFYKEKGSYYFGTRTVNKATFVTDEVNDNGELTFKEESGMVSFARNLIPGLEVVIYYIPISQGYVIIEKRIIKSIKQQKSATTPTASPSGGSDDRMRLLQATTGGSSIVISFTEPLTKREGYSVRITIKTNEGLHIAQECSDNGICDRTTGQCQCFPGFSGSACQVLTNCPNNCNNNGRCVPYSKVLGTDIPKEIAGIYSTSDGDIIYGCLCDPGHRGPDCSLIECPSGEDPQKATNVWSSDTINSQPYRTPLGNYEHRDCSGRGICNYDTGSCTCFEGYKGTACEEMLLSTM